MKLRILSIFGFLAVLAVLLIGTMPAKQVIYRINFPSDMGLYEVAHRIIRIMTS